MPAPHCSQPLDIYGHHALICHSGGDVVTKYNLLHDCFADFCCRACLAPELERGCGLTSTKDRTHPADVLVPNWSLSHSAVFDLMVTDLNVITILTNNCKSNEVASSIGYYGPFKHRFESMS